MGEFSQNLLDGFELLGKRTTTTLKSTQQLGNLFKHVAENYKDFVGKMSSLCSEFKSKKLTSLDGTMQTTVASIVSEMDALSGVYGPFVEQLVSLSKEADGYAKDKEKKQKQLVAQGHKITKDWKAQVDNLKKAKENYVKLSKEAASAQASLSKKESDGSVKPSALSSQTQKTTQAKEKAKAAEEKYQETLTQTNERQKLHYEQEQPNLLKEFQQFEEERINFMRELLDKYSKTLVSLNIPEKWKHSQEETDRAVSSINVSSDISSWCDQNKTGVSVPGELEFESWDGSSVPSSSSPTPPRPAKTTPSNANPPVPKRAEHEHTPAKTNPFNDDDSAPQPQKPAPEPPAEEGDKYRALYDYSPTNDTELAIKEGDILLVTEKDESGWWYAVLKDKEGFIPAEYVERV